METRTKYLVGGGVAAGVGLLALRAKAVAKAKASATAAPAQQASPAQVAAAATQAGVTVPQLQQAAANAGTTPAAVIQAATQAGVAAGDAAAALVASATVAPAAVVQMAQVTTNDPAPSGDLVIRDQPNGTQIGGAEKDGLVVVINPNVDGDFAQISWAGGSRLGPAQGFAHKAFLRLL